MKLQDMTDRQLEEYCDRLRIANHASGRLDIEEVLATAEWIRRRDALLSARKGEEGNA